MDRRSLISLCKMLSRNPFGRVSNRKYPFPLISLKNFSTYGSVPQQLKKPHHFYHPANLNSPTYVSIYQDFRQYSVDADKEVDKINLKFVEAREDIESAMESKETVYFDEEAECARASVNEVLEMYEGLLKKLPDNQRSAIQRAMGLKIEQLKAEVGQLNED
ncbi:Hypothetical predicted protein [Olea europaea subsp. europaea]|uniref:Late embryogenesis abundant protein n=1 Tax=Olea europaea subsp. europaea TaxID=158383 RepID=A0A8S0U4A5_OLEEU|nr:Hypothetical predicted protein [Olea europaea subsp. europaea]